MPPILKNALAVIGGVVIGSLVNMGIVMTLGSMLVPDGVDPSDIESIKSNIDKYKPIHFLPAFLAHGLGTLAGAFTTAGIASTRQLILAMLIGAFFLLGGIMAVQMIPGPAWFAVLDLVGAYIPMAWLGHKLAAN